MVEPNQQPTPHLKPPTESVDSVLDELLTWTRKYWFVAVARTRSRWTAGEAAETWAESLWFEQ